MVESVDIVVYTNPKMLKHKQEDGFSRANMVCFWEFGRFPSRFRETHLEKLREKHFQELQFIGPQPPAPAPVTPYDFVGRIYFAIKGFVVGSFDIDDVDEDEQLIYFQSETWRKLETSILCKPFRGFRYRWW